MDDLSERVENLLTNLKDIPSKEQRSELRKILSDSKCVNSYAGVYCKSTGNVTDNLLEWDVNTGREGYTYIKTLNNAQQQDLVLAIEENETTEDGESQVFSVLGKVGVAAIGISYALTDGPYSFYVALTSLALFFAGTRIIPGFFTVSQYNAARERFRNFNPVTDQKEAVTIFFSNY